MRKPEKRRTSLTHLLERTWKDTERGRIVRTEEEIGVVIAADCTLLFLEAYDFVRGENHKTYFTVRYLSGNRRMSQRRIAQEYGLCEDTVGAYCRMYTDVFGYFLERLGQTLARTVGEREDLRKALAELTERAKQNRKKQPIFSF